MTLFLVLAILVLIAGGYIYMLSVRPFLSRGPGWWCKYLYLFLASGYFFALSQMSHKVAFACLFGMTLLLLITNRQEPDTE
jgi:hypothetical protein